MREEANVSRRGSRSRLGVAGNQNRRPGYFQGYSLLFQALELLIINPLAKRLLDDYGLLDPCLSKSWSPGMKWSFCWKLRDAETTSAKGSETFFNVPSVDKTRLQQ